MRENSPAETKVREGGGDVPRAGAEIPLQPMEKTMVMQVIPLPLKEDHSGANIHTAAPAAPHTRAGRY